LSGTGEAGSLLFELRSGSQSERFYGSAWLTVSQPFKEPNILAAFPASKRRETWTSFPGWLRLSEPPVL
jgi:hypothetical protein